MEEKKNDPEAPKRKRFRFLTQREFEALSYEEQQEYVIRAFEEIQRTRKKDPD